MLKKTITFPDLDGNAITEDFYFNITKAEAIELETTKKGGLSVYLQQIIAADEPHEIIESFKQILTIAVGRRSDDNRRFVKNQDITDDFMQTNAYPTLFMELMENPEASAEFIRGVLPADLAAQISDQIQNTPELPYDEPEETPSVTSLPQKRQEPTREELLALWREKTVED